MKLKLTQPGYENMNGHIGITLFEDGVTVEDISPREARLIAISIQCEYLDGSSANPAQILLNSMHAEAEIAVDSTIVPVADPVLSIVYTQESLAAIADSQGIKGLREVAKTFGVKGVSVTELIAEILEAQGKAVAQ